MFSKIGFFAMCLGVMMGDTENLVIPTVVIAIGVALILIGARRGEQCTK